VDPGPAGTQVVMGPQWSKGDVNII